MKRIAVLMMMIACAASPAVAQWAGMPVWNNPKGGTGVTIDGDLAFPNSTGGKGTAFGARATLGIANMSFTAGLSSWKPNGYTSSVTSVGGTAQFKVIGGSLIPVALNIQLGAGTGSSATDTAAVTHPKITTIVAGAGISVNVPTPGLSIEPYLSVGNRWNKLSGVSGTQSNVGWVVGANLGFGMLGLHVAYDSQKIGSATRGVIGIGAHFALKAPIGM
ncbi:MAG: hypothetical protein DMD40_15465 [Gemmatimonadetes bacterium]|nr:MAG: hypothetical protein DMD40_15465 [Gemmatimonadota bacterium]